MGGIYYFLCMALANSHTFLIFFDSAQIFVCILIYFQFCYLSTFLRRASFIPHTISTNNETVNFSIFNFSLSSEL